MGPRALHMLGKHSTTHYTPAQGWILTHGSLNTLHHEGSLLNSISLWGVPLPSDSYWKVWLQVSPEKTRHVVFKSITGQPIGFPDCVPPWVLPRSREEKSIWKRIFVLKFLLTFKATLKSLWPGHAFLLSPKRLHCFQFLKNHLNIQNGPPVYHSWGFKTHDN